MPTGTKKAPAKKAPAKKATAKKAAASSTGNTNLDNLLKLVRSDGEEGITVKDLAARAGVTQETVRKGIKALEEDGKVKREGTKIFSAGRRGRSSPDVAARDEAVLKHIKTAGKEGLTKAQIVEAVDTTDQLAYESIWRLREKGLIHREGSTRNATWVAGK